MIKVNRKSIVAFWTNHNMTVSQQLGNGAMEANETLLIRALILNEI